MLMKELIELYEGKKSKKVEPVKPIASMEDQLVKFAKSGGEIVYYSQRSYVIVVFGDIDTVD